MSWLGQDDVKRAQLDHEVHGLVAARWSPYALSPEPLDPADVAALFEAARWAPSAFNEQPWRYLVAGREDEAAFARLLSCLVEPNQTWARHAGVLALGVVATTLARNGHPNGTAEHDLGLASAQLVLEATARGLVVHQMGGILPERARELYGIPAGFVAKTGLAIARPAPADALPEGLRERDLVPRTRRPLAETVFRERWGAPAEW
ncbi:MAG: nitroreductase family protein [Planctomycetes bacterium]|nr:nitroreductase family protein [Planctomycetota bacterium]